jgi:hypothetical protein
MNKKPNPAVDHESSVLYAHCRRTAAFTPLEDVRSNRHAHLNQAETKPCRSERTLLKVRRLEVYVKHATKHTPSEANSRSASQEIPRRLWNLKSITVLTSGAFNSMKQTPSEANSSSASQ